MLCRYDKSKNNYDSLVLQPQLAALGGLVGRAHASGATAAETAFLDSLFGPLLWLETVILSGIFIPERVLDSLGSLGCHWDAI